jgi:hypothetical protein
MNTNAPFFVRYQERIRINAPGVDEKFITVTDTLMPINEFLNWTTPETVESLLSNVYEFSDATGKRQDNWQDNGVCCITQAPLEHRVLAVVCEGNLAYTKSRMQDCPTDDELKEQYEYETLPCQGV